MTGLKPYAEYKDSGVAWLGEVPAAWRIATLRHVADVVNGGTPSPAQENWHGDVYWATPVDLNKFDGATIANTGRQITRVGLLSGSASIPAGSVLVSTRAPIGYSAVTDVPMAFNQGCKGLVPLPHRANAEYLLYLVQASKEKLSSLGQGTTFTELSSAALSALKLCVPSLEEQRAIALFLDHETAEIDAFIADQQELIRLLNERRAATITRAVTKGLNSDVPTKNSRIGWLGEVPQHWDVGATKNLGTIALGKMLTPSSTSESDVEAPYLRAANVQPIGRLHLGDHKLMWFTPNEAKRLTLRAGDVVIVEGGVGGYGRSAYILENLEGWGFQNSIVRIRPTAGVDGRFVTYSFLHLRHCGYIEMTSSVSSMPHFTAEKVGATIIAWPGAIEQSKIADYLDIETAEIDAAIADAKEVIELSKERRAALISAAVTGKIDVRNHPAAKGAA